MARLGKVSLGSGDQITLDFVGDGLMKVTVPNKQLGLIRDTKGRPLSSLIRNTGIIKPTADLLNYQLKQPKLYHVVLSILVPQV